MKPTKVGMKVYACTDAENAYVYSLEMYNGEKSKLTELIDKLTESLRFKNRKLFMDNFSNSVQNTMHLAELGIRTCGTIRKNRGQPKELSKWSKILKKNE